MERGTFRLVRDASENRCSLTVLRLPYTDLTPIRLRSESLLILLFGVFVSPFVHEKTVQEPERDSEFVACRRGKQRASLAGSQNLPAIMADLPVPGACPKAVLGLAFTERLHSKENSHMITSHPNSNKLHRKESPNLISSFRRLITIFLQALNPDGQPNLR